MKIVKLEKEEKKTSQTRIYFFGKDQDLKVQRKLLPAIFQEVGLREDNKVKFSRYAGCSCGCSPGFIVQGHIGFDIFVNE